MNSNSLALVGVAFERIGAVFAERRRQEGAGAVPPFDFVDECMRREISTLRNDGQSQLADTLEALRSDMEAMDNG